MKLKIDDIQFHLLIDEEHLHSNRIPVLFLHGFTGSSYDWNFIFKNLPDKFLPIALDLVGHGQTDSPNNPDEYTCTSIVRHIDSILNHLGIKKIIVAGYSMGGRAALSYSLKHPQKIIAAILESGTAGIEEFEAKKERVEHDLLLAEQIKIEGVESFLEYWLNQPLFNSLQEIDKLKDNRSRNSVVGLANSLSAFSTGLMNSYWNDLYKLDFPVLLITGGLDEKFTSLNKRMLQLIKNAEHFIVPQTGHNTHLEKPELFTNLVLDFLHKTERL
jgi:2-succinyl-6-hydroxy-2,4-cyclohexadiene-1-carboxylate synthase